MPGYRWVDVLMWQDRDGRLWQRPRGLAVMPRGWLGVWVRGQRRVGGSS
jgi:hypothetical protein